MVLFTLIPIDFLAYVIQFFQNASLTQSGSLDPDINFNADETPCDYFIENQFNKMLRRENYSDANFSSHNLVNLTDYLSCLKLKFSVIGISETWLNDPSQSVDIYGSNFFTSISKIELEVG